MSIKLTQHTWCIEGMTPAAKLLLTRLTDFADDEGGSIFPSVGRLAREVGVSTRTVQRMLQEFCAAGLLIREAPGGSGPGNTALYRVIIPTLIKIGLLGLDGIQHAWSPTIKPRTDATRTASRAQMRVAMSPRVTDAPEKGDSGVWEFIKELESLEGENARARARQSARATSLNTFLNVWPLRAYDNQQRIRAAWKQLTEDERVLAIAYAGPLKGALQRLGRTLPPPAAGYLEQKPWRHLMHDVPKPRRLREPLQALAPYSPAWWAALTHQALAQKASGFMLKQARAGKAWAARESDMPPASALRAFRHRRPDDPAVIAWFAYFERAGLRLADLPDDAPIHLPEIDQDLPLPPK